MPTSSLTFVSAGMLIYVMVPVLKKYDNKRCFANDINKCADHNNGAYNGAYEGLRQKKIAEA